MWPLRADSPRDKLERQRILWLAALVRTIGSSACKWSKKITGLGQSVKDKALEGSGQWLSLLRGKKWMKSLSLIPEIQYIEIPLSDSWITSWAQRTRWCQEICKCPGTQKGDLSPTHLFDLRLAKPLAGPLSKRLSPSGRPAQFQDFQAIQAPTGRLLHFRAQEKLERQFQLSKTSMFLRVSVDNVQLCWGKLKFKSAVQYSLGSACRPIARLDWLDHARSRLWSLDCASDEANVLKLHLFALLV